MTSDTSSRAKKQAARQTALERAQRQRTIRIAGIVILAVFGVGGLIFWVASETVRGQTEWAVRPTADPDEQRIPGEGKSHVDVGQPLTFRHHPPSSGNHYPQPAGVGFYEETFAEGYWVHSLEHGNVVVLYNCAATDDCAGLKNKVRDFVLNSPAHECAKPRLLGVPYSQGLSTPLALVAWAGPVDPATGIPAGIQLDLPQFDGTRMLNFYKRYENHGPEHYPEQIGCP